MAFETDSPFVTNWILRVVFKGSLPPSISSCSACQAGFLFASLHRQVKSQCVGPGNSDAIYGLGIHHCISKWDPRLLDFAEHPSPLGAIQFLAVKNDRQFTVRSDQYRPAYQSARPRAAAAFIAPDHAIVLLECLLI